jgi:hypothetical protein
MCATQEYQRKQHSSRKNNNVFFLCTSDGGGVCQNGHNGQQIFFECRCARVQVIIDDYDCRRVVSRPANSFPFVRVSQQIIERACAFVWVPANESNERTSQGRDFHWVVWSLKTRERCKKKHSFIRKRTVSLLPRVGCSSSEPPCPRRSGRALFHTREFFPGAPKRCA